MDIINNYSFSPVTYVMEEGIEIGSVAGYHAVITITPLEGFTATASNFSAVNPDPTYVNTITFTQDGDNVLCNIYLVQGVTMPSNDITISICVTGGGVGKDIDIFGKISSTVGTNVGGDSQETNTPYSNSGSFGQLETLLTRAYTANTGYYWPTSETPYLNVTVGNQSNYNITQTGTFDASNRLTGLSFTVKYLYPNQDVSGDKLDITVPNAVSVRPTQPVEITSYSQLPLYVGESGETVAWTIYGQPNAEYSASMTDGTTTITLATNETIGPGGTSLILINFPALSSIKTPVCWTITLTGDLQSPFNQPNPVQVCQEADITVMLRPYTTSNINNLVSWTPISYVSEYTPYTENAGSQHMSFRVTAPDVSARPVEVNDIEQFSYDVSCRVDGSVTNASSINIKDLTQNEGTLAVGDRFNINDNSGYAPFTYEVTAVNSATNISVSPNITASDNDAIVFYRNNGNIVSVNNSEVIRVTDNSVDLNFDLQVDRSGDENIIFEINLAEIISYDPT